MAVDKKSSLLCFEDCETAARLQHRLLEGWANNGIFVTIYSKVWFMFFSAIECQGNGGFGLLGETIRFYVGARVANVMQAPKWNR